MARIRIAEADRSIIGAICVLTSLTPNEFTPTAKTGRMLQ